MKTIEQEKEALTIVYSTMPTERKEKVNMYFGIYGVDGLFSRAKEKAISIKNYADRKGYGQGECGYFFSNNDEDNEDYVKDFPEFYNEFLRLAYAYFDFLYEAEEF